MKKAIVLLWLVFPLLLLGQDYKNDYKNNKCGLIDDRGNIIIPYNYSYIYKAWNTPPSIYCIRTEVGNKTLEGVYDIKNNKELIPCLYDECLFMNNETVGPSVFVVKKGGKTGTINFYGQTILPVGKYDSEFCCNFKQGYFHVTIGKKEGMVNYFGKEIIPCMYDQVIWSYGDGDRTPEHIARVKLNDKWGCIDVTTEKVVVPIEYYYVMNVSENLALVNKGGRTDKKDNLVGGKWGFVSILTGEEIIPIEYDEAQAFKDGVARVKKGGQLTLIKNPLKEGNAIALAQASSAKKDPNAPAVSRYPAPNSDVDKNIPQSSKKNENLFAFIIANENYPEAPVPYALNDGRIFKEYCLKTLGLPEKQVRIFEDATVGRIIAAVEQIKEIANVYDGEAEIILYYAGHGVPDDKKSTAYLLPVDGSSSDIIHTGYSLEKLYTELSKLKLKSISIFLDACFSGSKREDEMLASARGVAIKVKDEAPKGNMVVFSAATGDETAHQYEEKGHGLFTYFLLKKLQETQGNVNFGDLSAYVTQQVKRQSVVINNKRQTPTVTPSESLVNWQGLRLK